MAIETRRAAPIAGTAAGGLGLQLRLGRPGFRGRDRMFLTERLGLLLETGTPLHTGLQTLSQQASGGEVRQVVGALERDVASGLSFADSLRRQSQAFPQTYVSLVAAAERGGFLPQVLQRLHEMEEARRELRSTLVGALSYPAFLVVFSLAVVVFVLVVVFPKFSELFGLIQDQLPVTTLVLMAMSDGLRRYWIAFGGLGVGSLVLAWRWARSPGGAALLDRLAYATPLVRQVAVELHLVQFLRVMSLSLANGVPLLEALRASETVVASPRFRRFIADLEECVTQGRGLAVGFREARFLPPLVGQLISTGEETGNLARVMARVADFYERAWRKRLATASKLVEPVLLLVMGVVVGLIVSSLLLPIFKLSRAVA